MKPGFAPRKIFRFQDFALDTSRFELRQRGVAVKLEKVPMELLTLLVERGGELVTRQEIVQRLWPPDVFVDTEQGINTAVRKIRLVLQADGAAGADPIQTVVGKGYRFGWSIEPEDRKAQPENDSGEQRMRSRRQYWIAAALAVLAVVAILALVRPIRARLEPNPQIKSVAVLPLANFSGTPEQEFFVDGMTDAIITRLAQVRGLKVISRTSVMQFKTSQKNLKEIARVLDVDAVVEGSAVRSGDRVRVTAQLIDARTDRHLWAAEFERKSSEVLSLESEVAGEIARRVAAKLSPEEQERFRQAKAVDPEAYEAYLRARTLAQKRTPDGLSAAIEQFNRALQIEPLYSEAYAGLADSYAALGYNSYVSPQDSFPKAIAAAQRALELDPNSAEAHAGLGYSRFYFDWDIQGAEKQFSEALIANPNHATTHHWRSILLTSQGRYAEARQEIEKAHELDPLSVVIDTDMGFELYYAGQYDEAIRHLNAVLAANDRFPAAHLWLGRCYEEKKMYADAIRELTRADELVGDWAVTIAAKGHAEGVSGNTVEARKTLARLQRLAAGRFVTPYAFALVFAALNDKPKSLQWLERAREDRSHWLMWLRTDPRFKNLREEKQFQDLVQRISAQS